MLRRTALALSSPHAAHHLIAEEVQTREQAGAALRKKLVGMHVSKEMSAVDLAIVAHWHTLSGGCGLEDLAKPPGDKSGELQCPRKARARG